MKVYFRTCDSLIELRTQIGRITLRLFTIPPKPEGAQRERAGAVSGPPPVFCLSYCRLWRTV